MRSVWCAFVLLWFAACGGVTGGGEIDDSTEGEGGSGGESPSSSSSSSGGGSEPETLVFCAADDNPCTTGPALGPDCWIALKPDGTPCGDGKVCTGGECL